MFKIIISSGETINVESKFISYFDGNYYFYNEENKNDMDAPIALMPEKTVSRIFKTNNEEK